MKIGDLVVRTYGEHPRPMAIVVGWHEYGNGKLAQIRWLGGTRVEEIGTKYLEVRSEAR
jgi:hypothetical protein